MVTFYFPKICLVALICLSVGVGHCRILNDDYRQAAHLRVKRIARGETTPPRTYTFVSGIFKVSNKKFGETFICGATFISNNYALTAAHCVHDHIKQKYGILSATHDLSDQKGAHKIMISQVHLHPNFMLSSLQNDIAVLKLETNILRASTICLPLKNPDITENLPVKIVGWGATRAGGSNSRVLMKSLVKVMKHDICRNSYRKISQSATHQICTKEISSPCKGDSGGPLLMEQKEKYIQIGLISYGPNNCVPTEPSIHTNIYPHIAWIKGFTTLCQV